MLLVESGIGHLDKNKSEFFGGQFRKLGRIISWVELFLPFLTTNNQIGESMKKLYFIFSY